jgi:hypothetical protein
MSRAILFKEKKKKRLNLTLKVMKTQAKRIQAMMREIQIQKMVFLGHGMGL